MTTGRSERFDHYVDRCLYGPDGFYATTGSAGRRGGDFLTSPEVGPLFGAVLARAVVDAWERLGRPSPFTVYDVGCGPGTLLRTVSLALDELDVETRPPLDLVGVDRVGSAGADRPNLPDDLTNSVVVANELLDNLPFRVVERTDDGSLAELYVADGAERLAPTDLAPVGAIDLPIGTRAPVLEEADRWVRAVLAARPALLLVIDYGAPTTAELAARGGWLRTYREHHRGHDPLAGPGSSDITTDVAWDQLPAPHRLETQADFLHRLGVEDLVEAGRRYWHDHAARPDLRAMRMRSRVSEAEALLDPTGLGAWWVATWENLGDSSRLGLIHDHG